MEFIAPLPFAEAIEKLGDQSVVGSTFSSSEWSDLPLELRDNAFFSSRVESARFLQRAKVALGDFLAGNKIPAENGEPALATGSRSAFVSQMQDFLAKEGVVRTTGGLTDIASEKRLGLIFDIKTRQAQDFGYWKQGMDPHVLNEFPAARFIRVRDVKEPRELHERFQDQVYLKTDPIWWLEINKDFGVPWGPWGWGCGHDVEDVGRDEAESLHLLRPGQHLAVGQLSKFLNLNHNLQASVKTMDPDLVDKLIKEFGDRITVTDDTIEWNPAYGVRGMPVLSPSAPPAPLAIRQSPVSDAIDLKVQGKLADQVNLALAAIDQVHDDGALASVPLYDTKQSAYGYVKPVTSTAGTVAQYVAVRSSGPWPALTAVHEVGHLLDLGAIGSAGDFASVRLEAGMAEVLVATEQSAAIAGLRSQLAATSSVATAGHLNYLLSPWEIWARAYAQFIAERSGNAVLQTQLQAAREAEKNRQWSAADFAPVARAIEKMFQQLGWL
jgi:hypothetical protein